MLTSARACSALLTFALGALLFTGCKKEEEAPQAVPIPSAAPAPVKATEDAPQAAQGSAAGSAAPAEAAPTPSAAPTPTEAPKAVAAPSIDGCCSALQALAKDPKANSTVKSKAASAAAMCAGTAKLVKEGKASRSTALTQIRATMAGSAPSACN
ncbi:hypothetical protein [Polyangium sp. 6x1]|uniref:hypothetical protein n=1 Tax=Polyangium sp. 6x1 TaxID=3042689 RepID=UPI00248313BC|nr:hypothetical protein [Polyangium sp. 6x1]MDI1451354.1 hypothetical protein [Polyangium sp. 6x1]